MYLQLKKAEKYANSPLMLQNYWYRLFRTSMTWLLWDLAFYGNKLYQSKFLLVLTGENTILFELTVGMNPSSFINLFL